MESSRRRVLIVANRTAAAPDLIDAVKRHAEAQPTAFTLLIPGAREADWTLESALPLLERAARGPVARLTDDRDDPVEAVRVAVARDQHERILLSARRRGLPKRVEALGVPVEVIASPRQRSRGVVADGLGLSWPHCSLCRVSAVRARGRATRS